MSNRNVQFSSPTTSSESEGRRISIADAILRMPRKSIRSIKARLTKQKKKPPSIKAHLTSDSNLTASTISFAEKLSSTLATSKSVVSLNTRHVTLAKWSRKLYGSEKAVKDECLRVLDAGPYIIHPYSNFRFTWDLLSALIIIMNIIVIPMDLAFSGETSNTASLTFKFFSDIWFMVDIILNFRTGVSHIGQDGTSIELNPKKIARIYLKGWFTIDVIASFPLDSIVGIIINAGSLNVGMQGKKLRLLKVIKILQVVRVARIPRLIRGLHQWEEIFNLQYDMAVSLLRLTYLIFIIFILCHWNGCLQYMVPMFYDFPDDTWVKMRGLEHPNVTWFEAYSWSLFKSTSQMLCIGYSEVIPVGMIDLWMTMLSQTTGALMFALFIGNAINMMEEMDSVKNAYKMKVSQITEYMGFRRLPCSMKRRILDYFDVRYIGKLFDEKAILKELSPGLRRAVIWHNCASLIHSVPIFDDVSDDFVADLGEKLEFTVYTPDDVVVKEGDRAYHMFFILHGELTIKASDDSYIQEISDGMHFGETCLVNQDLRRAASVIAATNVHLYTLNRTDFNKVAALHDADREKIETRFKKIRERSSQYDFIKKFGPQQIESS